MLCDTFGGGESFLDGADLAADADSFVQVSLKTTLRSAKYSLVRQEVAAEFCGDWMGWRLVIEGAGSTMTVLVEVAVWLFRSVATY
jgi:hypothetical protein